MPNNNWDTSLYDQKHAFVYEYGKDLIPLLQPQPGELILDLGCGTGHLTHAIAESGAHVIGIDSSASMIATAQSTYPQLEFHVKDARDFSFASPFDAIFSNATLHWIPEADQVVRCVAASLKPGGRFVAEFGGKGNVATITSAVQQSMRELLHEDVDFGWYFPTIGEYASLLEKHDLDVRSALLFDRPTPLEDGEMGLRNWIQMFGERVLRDMPNDVKHQILACTEDLTRERLYRNGQWTADYTRLRIVAYKA
ncbi:MAG TPA: methyltransferase domain-containing protein [Ktedonobacteraceae bacterium]|nr:methyltransferase domain-containing protein [Ktedonobacteraceae bacterium]